MSRRIVLASVVALWMGFLMIMPRATPATGAGRGGDDTSAEARAVPDYPQLSLSNGQLSLSLYLPDAEKGYYRGTRFDWSGLIRRVEYRGHTFFGEWRTPHEPARHDDVVGPAEEFGMAAPLGYSEARVGESVVKIGVGLLEKIEEERYRFSFPYRIVRPGSWEVSRTQDRVEYRQSLTHGEWGYRYTKRIQLVRGRPVFRIFHRLRNTGTRPIETDQYNHNFFIIDDTPIGPAYTLRFPFSVTAQRPLQGYAETRQERLVFTKELEEGRALFTELQGHDNVARHHRVTIENTRTAAGVEICGNRPLSKLNFFAVKTAVCPEPFIQISLAPGREMTWETEYRFYVR